MARRRRRSSSKRRRSSSSKSVKFGSFLKRSKSKGKKLITTGRAKGRPVYRVKGAKGWFIKLGSAKSAANKLAYGKKRSSSRRRRRR